MLAFDLPGYNIFYYKDNSGGYHLIPRGGGGILKINILKLFFFMNNCLKDIGLCCKYSFHIHLTFQLKTCKINCTVSLFFIE